MRVLVLNAGSSTLKASLVADGALRGDEVDAEWPPGDTYAAGVVGEALTAIGTDADAVGYRVVHGGTAYRSPALVDDELLGLVDELDALAPLHNRRAAVVMRAGRAARPDVPHVACFDTAFHAGLAESAWRYPLPAEWVERWGIRRFGFHGLSVAWATRQAASLLGRPVEQLRIVVAHLGSGCSVTAVDGGRSVDTTMGFTPYEGLMMGTRSGSVDPGILLHLLRGRVAVDDLADGLAQRSGLRAVAGTSDLREVETRAAAGDAAAGLTLEMFSRRAAAGIAAVTTALPELDALVFTGGIGEHSAVVREAVVRRLAPLRVPTSLRSVEGDGVVADGPPAVLVVEARENLVIASDVEAMLTDE